MVLFSLICEIPDIVDVIDRTGPISINLSTAEVRQPDGQYVNLSAIFGTRLRQEANDWLVAPLWI